MAIVPDVEKSSLMISKIYVKREARGSGVGCRFLQHAESICQKHGFKTIWLTVNKYNADTIAWYERKGFENADTMVQDIGNGFIMDDFKMVKALPEN